MHIIVEASLHVAHRSNCIWNIRGIITVLPLPTRAKTAANASTSFVFIFKHFPDIIINLNAITLVTGLSWCANILLNPTR